MGYEMAKNVRQKMPVGSTLFVNDISRAQCEKFLKEFHTLGPVEIVETACEVAEKARIIISIVPAALHVKDVYLNPKTGVIAAPKDSNRLILECSTIDSESTIEVGTALKDAGVGTYIDTPVSVSPFMHILSLVLTFGFREVSQVLLLEHWHFS
jgi:3-hydroxyisobutyrate dehydrogenase